MSAAGANVLVAGVCDFGWGSLGKFRLILDHLPAAEVVLYGDLGIHRIATDMLGDRHRFVDRDPASARVGLVINDPVAARRISGLGVPVVYVDSLPYLWAHDDEIPSRDEAAIYCAQRFPEDRIALSEPLRRRGGVEWVDAIVPPRVRHLGGDGVVVNVGGLHSHLAGDTVGAYIRLVLLPLVRRLVELGRAPSAICGNLPSDVRDELAALVPESWTIGAATPYEFERLLQGADLLITSPGSTTILQASAMRLPTLLLPPQNLSQILNAELYSAPSAVLLGWPPSVLDRARVEAMRPEGEDAVLAHIYGAIQAADQDEAARREVAAALVDALDTAPEAGVLDPALADLGRDGGRQVAQRIRQAMLAPIPRPPVADAGADD